MRMPITALALACAVASATLAAGILKAIRGSRAEDRDRYWYCCRVRHGR